jgi:nitrogen fixation NifU-like protein
MSNDIDAFVERFQQAMLEEAKEKFGDVAYERWRNPLYMGVLIDADTFAHVKGSCGDSMVIYMTFENGRVGDASFQTDGCAPTIICGSFASEMAVGKTPDEIMDISGEDIMRQFGGLPKENEHCATLAAGALHEAVHNYMVKQTRGGFEI